MEPDSSTKKQGHGHSVSCRHPVTVAAGSSEDLGKLEHEHGIALKRSRSLDTGVPDEHPCPKEQWAERGRSHECRCTNSPEHPPPPPFLFTPMAPSHPITGSLCALSLDSNRGSLPLDRGGDTEVPLSSTGLVTLSSAHQPVQSSGLLANVQVDSIFVTSRLTAEQYEEIFLLSRDVQTLCGKLALEFIQLSHEEALFRMGAQATSHEKGIREHPRPLYMGKCGDATQCLGESHLVSKPIPFSFITL